MAVTAGALTQLSVGSNGATLQSAVATAGTAPYTYQWYRSTTTGFTPGGGNIITGATSLTLVDTGLIPNTVYYYKVIATDAVPATSTSTQLVVTTTAQSLSPNQFAQVTLAGVLDGKNNWNSIPCLVDLSQSGTIYASQPVKFVNSVGGVPKVIACTANSDVCYGFVNYSFINTQFVAGQPLEISQTENLIYLYATTAIPRGSQVTLDIANNGVGVLVGSSGASIVGWAFDEATAAGQLIRVKVRAPSFAVA